MALVATARRVTREEMLPALSLLSAWGLEVVEPEGLYAEDHQLAGSDSVRAAAMQHAIDDPDIKAIFCARGGYGTVRMVDAVDYRGLAEHPKWVVGYSDATVLHSHIHRVVGLPTLHATMPINFPDRADEQAESIFSMREWLFEGRCRLDFATGAGSRKGNAEGMVVGGNLSVLYSLCGSPSALDTRGKILLIEDLDEYLYHIDRMMMNLKRNGMLDGLAGLLVGSFSDMHDNAVPFGHTAEEIVMDAVAEYAYPVAIGVPVGHIGTANRALPLGVRMRLSVSDERSTLYMP